MNYLKKLALSCTVIIFVLSVSAVATSAQWSKKRSWQNRDNYSQARQYRNIRSQNNRRWQNRNAYRNNRGYRVANYRYTVNRNYPVRNYRYANQNYQVRNYGYANRNYRSANYRYANRNYQNRGYQYIRVSPREARRIQRQRARQYQSRNIYARGNRFGYGEKRRMANRQQQYRRVVYRVRY